MIVASRLERGDLEECLARLLPPCAEAGAEVVVVRSAAGSEVLSLSRAHPEARFVQAPHDATMRQLRSIGMSEASGDIVAITDEHGASHEWIAMLLRHGGGAIRVDTPIPVDWGSYFAEQGLFAELRPALHAEARA